MAVSDFVQQAGVAIRRAYCTWLGVNANAANYGANIGIPGSASYRDNIRAFRLGVCGDPTPPTDALPTATCPDSIPYRVTSGTLIDGTTTGQGPQNVQANPGNLVNGPFTGVNAVSGQTGQTLYYLVGPNLPVNSSLLYQIRTSYLNPRPYATFTRDDNQPTGCTFGPPPITPAPSNNLGPITINFNNDFGVATTITGNLTLYAPIIGSFNEVAFPVTFDVGGVNLSFEIGAGGDVRPKPGGFPSVGPSLPLPPPAGNDDPNPPDSDRPIIGVVVSVTALNKQKATLIRQTNLPDLYVPRLARVQFRIRSGNNRAWTGEIPVKSKLAYIPCPVDDGAVAANVSAEIGVTLTFSKVYGAVLPAAP